MQSVQIFLLNLLIIITLIWILFGFVIGVAVAPNNDMSPNIKATDFLMYYRLENNYSAQDIVVIRKNSTLYVGRIVAVDGDTVNITDDEKLQINGSIMSETNIYTSTPRYEGFAEYPLTVPKGACFVLSDMRYGGEDSRYYGLVYQNEILGKVTAVLRRNNM